MLHINSAAYTRIAFLGPVHTNPFSNKNGAVLLRIRLSFTLQRRKQSPKTEPFENALQSGANRPRSIYQYSSMAPRLSGQNCKFFKFPLSLNSQKRLRYRENNTKYRGLTWKPRNHVRILIYRTWPIENDAFWKRCFLVWTEKTMLSENGDVIKIDTTGRQTSRPWVSKMAGRFRGSIYWNAQVNNVQLIFRPFHVYVL